MSEIQTAPTTEVIPAFTPVMEKPLESVNPQRRASDQQEQDTQPPLAETNQNHPTAQRIGFIRKAISEFRNPFKDQKTGSITPAMRPALRKVEEMAVEKAEEIKRNQNVISGQEDFIVEQGEALDKAKNENKIDHMTGLDNRKGFEEKIYKRIENAIKTGRSFYYIEGDINDLKNANDNYSHVIGDTLITQACEAINTSVRKSDDVGRDSGDVAHPSGDEVQLSLDISSEEDLKKFIARAQNAYNNVTVNASSEEIRDVDGIKTIVKKTYNKPLGIGFGAIRFDPLSEEFQGLTPQEIYLTLKNRSAEPMDIAKELAKNPGMIPGFDSRNVILSEEMIEQNPDLQRVRENLRIKAEEKNKLGLNERELEKALAMAAKAEGITDPKKIQEMAKSDKVREASGLSHEEFEHAVRLFVSLNSRAVEKYSFNQAVTHLDSSETETEPLRTSERELVKT